MFGEESPFRARLVAGAPDLVVVTGENASGKSLFARVVAAKAHTAGVLPVSVSIRERTGSGSGEMNRLRQAMMFGDEAEQSTGATSARAVTAAFGNLDRDGGSVLLLDEPELGLSDGYARALGEHIGVSVPQVPAACAGTVVVTHSRTLVAGLRQGRSTTPTWVHVTAAAEGVDPELAVLEDWVAWTEERSVADLLALPQVGLDRFRTVAALLRGD